MADKDYRVMPKGSTKVTYGCGHVSWTDFSHEIYGHEYLIRQETIRDRELCGECLLEQAVDGVTRCARCGRPIFRGQDCIMYGNDLCCLAVACGPGPAGNTRGSGTARGLSTASSSGRFASCVDAVAFRRQIERRLMTMSPLYGLAADAGLSLAVAETRVVSEKEKLK